MTIIKKCKGKSNGRATKLSLDALHNNKKATLTQLQLFE